MNRSFYLYLGAMAITTYLIRMLPLVLLKKELKSPFIHSFLYYVPYACLAAMTFPAILTAPKEPIAGAIGFAVALFLSYRERSMIFVALAACGAVYLVELLFL